MTRPLKIGTRGSKLALWQAEHVRSLLGGLDIAAAIVVIRTTGDDRLDASLAQLDRGVFVREIEHALLRSEVDLAVHSMKDLPTSIPAGLTIAAYCARHDVQDCLVSRTGARLRDLPAGGRVGTSSLRRQAQLRHHRPELICEDIRGNVDTRLRKLREGQYDAIVLARAGLERLGLAAEIAEILDTDVLLPAVGQGAVGIEAREDDAAALGLLARIDHAPTAIAVRAERALLREIEGGCQVPLGAWCRPDPASAGELLMDACMVSLDGGRYVREHLSGVSRDPESLGVRLAHRLRAAGGDAILAELRSTASGDV
ncbi:MAG: hydroxymethylbilane synthase [Candidatus Schekmanbacteria bacterium]|nr:hydroxymethylbilane synthase [Candidatus Schekmanbacteria bacterium]